jgi:hypothetical protein
MATWKKLVVSGSNISQLNNDSLYISASQVAAAENSFSTASFNGTNLLADSSQGTLNFASGSTGLNIVATEGTDTLTFDLVAVPNASLANSTVHISGSGISLNSSISLGTTASIDVLVDNSTIELDADALRLKDGGVTIGKLADALVVTAAETIAANDNDTTIATNAAIIDYVQSASSAAGELGIGGDGTTSTTIDLDSQTLSFSGADGIQVSASAQAVVASIADGGIANAKLVTDSIKIGDASFALGSTASLAATKFNSGSFSGSFEGDGSGLTGIASTLNFTDGANPQGLDLKTDTLTITGTSAEVEVDTSTADTITIGLPDDVTIGNDLVVSRDATISRNLTVLGTASFQHTEDLDIADRFIRLASGSNAPGDGGIVIQQTNALDGEVFGFDSTTTRFGFSGSFDASQNVFVPDAFMAAVINTAGNDPNGINAPDPRYQKKGNLYVASNSEDIWVYS